MGRVRKSFKNIFELTSSVRDAILAIHSVCKILDESKVEERVIYLLIQDRTKVPMATIIKIFKALRELPEAYLVKEGDQDNAS